MRILNIIDHLSLGGAQAVVKGTIENCQRNNHFLFVLRKTDITISIDQPNVFIFDSDIKYSLKPLKELKEIIDNEKIEVLHCHLFRAQFLGWLLKKRYFPEIKIIFHEHGRIFSDIYLYNLFIKHSVSQVDLFLAVSEATKKHLIRNANIPDNKIKVLYNFVDTRKYNRSNILWNIEEERIRLGINRHDFVVGFAARMTERKGWHIFVEAADSVLKKCPNIKFLIAGDGKDKERLIRLINRKNLFNKIIFIGYISNMVWFYSLLNCFIIPSQWEPMGLTDIEAQAMGIPVISSDVEALNEIIKDEENGLLFEANNHNDLAKKIIRLRQYSETRQKLINGGYETVKKFNLDAYLLDLNMQYEGLIN